MIPVDVLPNLPAARVPYGDARLGVLVARRAWPASPCNGHEQVTTSWRLPDFQGMPAAAPGWRIDGVADLAGHRCRIWVREDLSRAETCSDVVHEAGHWAGLEHTDADRFPIMAADPPIYPGCGVAR